MPRLASSFRAMIVQWETHREVIMSRVLFATAVFLLAAPGQLAAQGKGIRFWNLTPSTFSRRQERLGRQPDPERQGQGGRPRRAPAHHRRGAWALRCQGRLSRLKAMFCAGYRDQGRCGVFDRRQGFEGLQQVARSRSRRLIDQPAGVAPLASALSWACGYSQRHLTAFHFGCSPTHCAM